MPRIGTTDLHVHPLNLGGNVFGWTADEAESFAVLDAYAAGGGDFIDTADVYSAWVEGNSGGESESVIGRWMSARGNRDELVIATKVSAHPERKGLKAANVVAAAEDSLRRLGTDRIDLYYTHFDDESVPVAETLGAYAELVEAGKVRYIAASNMSPERLTESLDTSEREGLPAYVAIQPKYNLVSRESYEGPLAEIAAARGLSAMPYYGLASGFLTGKYRPGAEVASARAGSAAQHLETPRGVAVLAALDEVAARHGAEPATIALAWLLAKPTVTAPIASARTAEQVPALLAVADVKLTAEDVALLDEASA